MSKKDLILICARKGSKGIINKNLKKVGKYPLFVHSIRIAKKLKKNYEIFISSDNEKIIDISKKYNVNTIFRSSKLSKDNTSEILVWKNALKEFEKKFSYLPGKILILPPTSPLRNLNDIKRCIKKYQRKKFNLVISGHSSNNNPYFNMVKKKGDFVKIISNKGIFRRQDAPKVYNISTACYIINTNYLMRVTNIFKSKVGLVEIPKERSIDIDDELDLFIANKIYEKKRIFS
ncbi:acylneuraminate cytidylyltransferase family protein [Candidatus Pelagibacter sp.]|nr:acylneuraminate cytidylyltransferase family protein [Candidatus Pelagibacter sp.]|tara:strand:+ start:809 stop:1507 length:699 start_codon:yes stop_codon:yes gene_type:complete